MNSMKIEIMFLKESFKNIEKISSQNLLNAFLETVNVSFQKYLAKLILKQHQDINEEYKGCLLYFLLKNDDSYQAITNFFLDPYIKKTTKQDFYIGNIFKNRSLSKINGIDKVVSERKIKSYNNLKESDVKKLLKSNRISIIEKIKISHKYNLDEENIKESLHEYLRSISLYQLSELRKVSYLEGNPLVYDFWDKEGYDFSIQGGASFKLRNLFHEKYDEVLLLLLQRADMTPTGLNVDITSANTLKKEVYYRENTGSNALLFLIEDPFVPEERKIELYYRETWHCCTSVIYKLLENISLYNAFKLYKNRRYRFYGHYQDEIFHVMLRRLKFPKKIGHNEPDITKWFYSLDTNFQENIFLGSTVDIKELLTGIYN